MRDFAAELADVPCWNREAEFNRVHRGVPDVDVALQNRAELVLLCRWIEAMNVRSYLEVGVWTGRVLSTLHRLFRFEKVAACDLGWAEDRGLSISLPPDCALLRACSRSADYVAWRERLGHFDLVLIDGDHRYEAVKGDFEVNRALPHRFLAFHDIATTHPGDVGVRRLWGELPGPHTLELVRPLPVSRWRMGIGIWSAAEDPRPPGWAAR
ncbi:MAG: class I SAM-dependent methyltransferase [Planctomycetes bacterium]|nr:class I SAM-dependent methyltransferase [Planctomycetota bacterium]